MPLNYVKHTSIRIFNRIAEPRAIRIIHFGIYMCFLNAGAWTLFNPDPRFEGVLGVVLVMTFGVFLTLGGIFGVVSVLPGIWWLEKAGIIALITGMAMYFVVVWTLQTSIIPLSVSVAFILHFVLRWTEIKDYQLAPREG